MAWYNTGSIALTNGSATVTGSGTNFLVGAQIGEALYAPDGKLYEIQTINSATVITLASNYLGSTATGQSYQIIPTQSLVADLASDVTDLISDFANVRDYAGNGKFNDGAVGTPGITFTQDQDNGLYRIGANNWALAAGGIKQVDLSATDVEINYAGVKKLSTTASGIDVTGSVTADGLTVDGNPVINGTSPQLFLQTGASNTNWQIAAQENVANAFEISSGAADASAPDDTYTPRLVILNTGSVGIGASLPANKLHVRETNDGGTATVALFENAATLAASQSQILLVSGGNTDRGAAISSYNEDVSGQPTSMIFSTSAAYSAPTERLRIDSSGNLLLNTTNSPTTTHAIISSDYSASGTTNTGLSIAGRASGNWYNNGIHALGTALAFSTGTTGTTGADATNERMRIDASGNLLLNTIANAGGYKFRFNGVGAIGDTDSALKLGRLDANTAFLQATSDAGVAKAIAFMGASEYGRFDASGHAIIPAGVTLGTAAGVYNAANTLEDYEEGTFTPTISGSTTAGVFTYNTREGRYTKVGNAVSINIAIQVTGTTTSAAGAVNITGLPFSVGSSFPSFTIGWSQYITFSDQLSAYGGATQITLRNSISGGSGATLDGSALGSTFYIFISGTYHL